MTCCLCVLGQVINSSVSQFPQLYIGIMTIANPYRITKITFVVHSLSHVCLFATPWTRAAHQASLSSTVSWSLPRFMPIELVMLSNHLTLCFPLLLPQSFLPSESFPMSQLFISDGQSIGASASVLQMTIQGWFPLRLTSLISLQSKGLSCQSIRSKRLKTFIYIYIYIKDCIKGLFDMESGGWQNWLKEG